MTIKSKAKSTINFLIILLIISTLGACAYYNTMFNAFKLYDEGTKKIANSKEGKITPNIKKDFNSAIDKCWTLINIYSDSNSWADDALLLIGKSHYQIEEYNKSERFLDQFIRKYPRSDLIYEAKIWYAKVLIALDEDEKALDNLNNILTSDVDSELKAEALSSIGAIYYKRGDYKEAIKNLEQCVEISDDDILSASSQNLIGNIYFDQGKYVDAIENFNNVLDFDPLEEVEFSALMKKVDAQIALDKVDLAIKTLNQMLRNSKLIDKYSLVEAKLGECFRLQNNYDFATEHYLGVIKKYPRSLGSAQAMYELAKLLEFYYTNIDSARKMYLKVKQESNKSEYVQEAGTRANLLKQYLDLRTKIKKDYETLTAPISDSLSIDTSVTVIPDSSLEMISVADSDSVKIENENTSAKEHEKLIKKTKISLAKNQYSLAEFFLLNMQNYDSAATAYGKFIQTGHDSSKIPQAYHALSYLFAYKLQDSTKADSIDQLILQRYPDTPFSEYILMRRGEIKKEEEAEVDTVKNHFRRAEDEMFNGNYDTALNLFTEIAENDSGNQWAGKSRYAISWIYENKLKDIPKAIEAYTILAKEYPNSEYENIAKNKIKEPKVETTVDTTLTDSTASDSSHIEEKNEEDEENRNTNIEDEREEPAINKEPQFKKEEDELKNRNNTQPNESRSEESSPPKSHSLNFDYDDQSYLSLVGKGSTWKIFTV